jgi:hypothetical protein
MVGNLAAPWVMSLMDCSIEIPGPGYCAAGAASTAEVVAKTKAIAAFILMFTASGQKCYKSIGNVPIGKRSLTWKDFVGTYSCIYILPDNIYLAS